jgi:hypothetical protein
MIENKNAQEYKNIPNSSVSVLDKRTDRRSCRVELLRFAILIIPSFSVIQFIEGADIWTHTVIKQISVKEARLLSKLSKLLLTICGDITSVKLEIGYDELVLLRKWLELRMKHCEEERDNRVLATDKDGKEVPDSLKFNADSYIAMKLLLLDIRELMLGSIITEE